jgi:hypothetical protein
MYEGDLLNAEVIYRIFYKQLDNRNFYTKSADALSGFNIADMSWLFLVFLCLGSGSFLQVFYSCA